MRIHSGGFAVEAVAFLAGLWCAAAVLLFIAACTAIAIAFFLPARPVRFARVFVEWATALSGAGYVALALGWQQVNATDLWFSVPVPFWFGAVVALSYLPLCILLLLRVLEPQWPVLLAGRALGLPLRRIIATIFRMAMCDIDDAVALYAARLFADSAVLALVLSGWRSILLALVMLVAAAKLYNRLLRLVQRTGAPLFPPLFGPLPDQPPRLRNAPHLGLVGKLSLQLSLAVLIVVAALEFSGLGILRGWAAGIWLTPDLPHPLFKATALGAALQTLVPLILLAWLLNHPLQKLLCKRLPARYSVPLAAISPLALAYPAVLYLGMGWFPWLPLAIAGLVMYVCLQNGAAQEVYAAATRSTLVTGVNTPVAAARALYLTPAICSGCGPALSEVLSTAAAWFSAAALLAVVSGADATYPAAYALVWVVTAAVLQCAAVWQRALQPRPYMNTLPISATQEALIHDLA